MIKKVSYGLGYTHAVKRNSVNDSIIGDNAIALTKIVLKNIGRYFPHYISHKKSQQLVLKQVLDNSPTEIPSTERSGFRRDANTKENGTFELGNSESSPLFIIVGFHARNNTDFQTHNNATFNRLTFSNAVCKIGSKTFSLDGIDCDYDRDKYDQAYHEIKTFYILHDETNLLNPFISLQKLRIFFNSYVLICPNKKQQKNLNLVEFIFSAAFL